MKNEFKQKLRFIDNGCNNSIDKLFIGDKEYTGSEIKEYGEVVDSLNNLLEKARYAALKQVPCPQRRSMFEVDKDTLIILMNSVNNSML